jgi:hypothetical protein
MTLPIGSIVASILSSEDFNNNMPHGEHWQLADGHDCGPGELRRTIQNNQYYAALNPGNVAKVPDLRGVFLRGHNSGHIGDRDQRADGKGNTDLTPIGAYQGDDVGPHAHNSRVGYADAGYTGQSVDGGWHGSGGAATDNPAADQDHPRRETRPRSVTVNYFIRVK